MKYVDGFVLVVPKKNRKKYIKMANDAGKIWKKHGALGYFECVGNELSPDMQGMKMMGFEKLTKLKKDDEVWFSFIIYKNKKHRNIVNRKVMEEMKKSMEKNPEKMKDMPWDMKRFSWGGFDVRVEK
jgi:uncharacterized protein YbaA (DUF1428 family)